MDGYTMPIDLSQESLIDLMRGTSDAPPWPRR
jgi:hypothetical protein